MVSEPYYFDFKFEISQRAQLSQECTCAKSLLSHCCSLPHNFIARAVKKIGMSTPEDTEVIAEEASPMVIEEMPPTAAMAEEVSSTIEEAAAAVPVPKLTKKRKPSAKSKDTGYSAADETVVFDPDAELDPDTALKFKANKEKIQVLCAELCTLENSPESSDQGVEIEEAIDAVLSTAIEPAAVTVLGLVSLNSAQEENTVPGEASSTAPAAPVVILQPVEKVQAAMNALIARCVQGKSDALSALIPFVLEKMSLAIEKVRASQLLQENAEFVVSFKEKIEDSYTQSAYLESISGIKSVSERKVYGIAKKGVSSFEDTEQEPLWRWESKLVFTHFSEKHRKTVEEVRKVRNRYSKGIKALGQVLDQMIKIPFDKTKVDTLEEKASKLCDEIDKVKSKKAEEDQKKRDNESKKREGQLKRQQQEEERLAKKKQEEEEKLRKKEESDRTDAEKTAKKKVCANNKKITTTTTTLSTRTQAIEDDKLRKKEEEERKREEERRRLEKQRSVLGSFFVKKTPAKGGADAAGTPRSSDASRVIFLDVDKDRRYDDIKKANMSMSDIQKSFIRSKENFKNSSASSKKRCRKLKTIDVTVASTNNFSSAEQYSVVKQVLVDSRMKLLKFREDTRPAYWGTHSKRSPFVTGRKPFGKDHKLVDYDYDSEGDWEEGEEEGEDIGESGGEEDEDEGDDELEYDDVFRRDNDLGSDAGSDADMMAIQERNTRAGEERLGPTFVTGRGSSMRAAHYFESGLSSSSGTLSYAAHPEREKDVQRLTSYVALQYVHSLPPLADPDCEALSKAGRESKGAGAQQLKGFDEVAIVELIRFIHGKKEALDKLVEDFHAEFVHIPKKQIKTKVQDIAEKKQSEGGFGSKRWIVKADFHSLALVDSAPVEFTPQKPKVKRQRTVKAAALTSPVGVNLLDLSTEDHVGVDDAADMAIGDVLPAGKESIVGALG